MPPYKRQHYLPCVYLKNFSADGSRATRISKVWRVDCSRAVSVTVESQCASNYLFSSQNPEKSEEDFGQMENAYGRAMKKIWAGGDPTVFEYFSLILATCDLYARNIVHENQTGREGIHAYELRTTTLINRLILGHFGDDALPLDQIKARVMESWGVRLFRTPGGQIATSDHPALCFNWGKTECIDFILLPLTPTVCAAVFDKRTTRTTGSTLTPRDGTFLFDALATHCNSCLYTCEEPEKGVIAAFETAWQRRKPPRTTTDHEKWALELTTPRADSFSFIRPIDFSVASSPSESSSH